MTIRLGNFNCENLFFRYRILNDLPRLYKPKPKPIEFEEMVSSFEKVSKLLKEYEDPSRAFENKKLFEEFLEKLPNKSWKSLLIFMKGGSFINRIEGTLEDVEPISGTQRSATAMVIYRNKPDLVAVQEIESLPVLDEFHSKFISRFHKLPFHMLIEGNDPRGIDLGMLSNTKSQVSAKTHRHDKVSENSRTHIFSRDCLEVDIQLPDRGETLTVYVNHLKSQIGGGQEKRFEQTTRIKDIITERFGDDLKDANFVILGDLNCEPSSPELDPLLKSLKLVNVFENLDKSERWSYLHTYYDKKKEKLRIANVSQLDYVLLSPGLAKNNPNVKPIIERRGLVYSNEITQKLRKKDETIADIYESTERFPNVSKYGTEASDHCGIFVDLEV
jgi:endonuclease/exonuclease/phosphatase family metal-dependent hydrolase